MKTWLRGIYKYVQMKGKFVKDCEYIQGYLLEVGKERTGRIRRGPPERFKECEGMLCESLARWREKVKMIETREVKTS
jgi:hypothetical protein